MHAGQFATLEQVLNHYNTAPAEQIAQIIAFLKTLDSPVQADSEWLTAPNLPR